MAKSIYDTIKSEKFTVEHGAETHEFTTPSWLKEFTPEVMSRVDKMSEVAGEHGIHLALMHLGLQQAIIALRAAARPSDVKKVKQSMLADIPGAQDRLDAYLPTPLKPPGAKKAISQADAIAALKAAGVTKEQIMAMFG